MALHRDKKSVCSLDTKSESSILKIDNEQKTAKKISSSK